MSEMDENIVHSSDEPIVFGIAKMISMPFRGTFTHPSSIKLHIRKSSYDLVMKNILSSYFNVYKCSALARIRPTSLHSVLLHSNYIFFSNIFIVFD